jgi:hypothetical protein
MAERSQVTTYATNIFAFTFDAALPIAFPYIHRGEIARNSVIVELNNPINYHA